MRIMHSKVRDSVCIRSFVSGNPLEHAALLQSLHIISIFIRFLQLILIEVQVRSTSQHYNLVAIIKLASANLLVEWHVPFHRFSMFIANQSVNTHKLSAAIATGHTPHVG